MSIATSITKLFDNFLLKKTRYHKGKYLLFFLLLFCLITNSNSQVLSGVVTSSDGETIPFASIYIKELTTGTTTNLEGEYSIELPQGKTHVFFQALGFAKVEIEVNMGSTDMVKNITLRPQDYKIKEVRVFSGDEDPAYGIMRKAISLAPYFLRQIKHYESNVYLKGGFDMKKVPRLFRKQLREEGLEQGKTYVTESINEITFNSPNRYIHKQISKRSTIPNDGEDEVIGFLNYSFYDSDSELAISPVSRKAFSFYKFQYEGFFQQGEYYVNKIKVTPKRKNQKLFDGYIYIVDKLWNIHSVDLINEQFFGKIRIKQVQEPVKGKAWLPVSHHFDVDIKMMGFKVTANYGGSVKYEGVVLDQALPVPSSLKKAYAEAEVKDELQEEIQEKKEMTKAQQKIDEMLQKEDLSNREMLKLSRLMEKENQGMEQVGKGLRLDSRDSLYQIVKDTVHRDSIDWNKIRPIPLSKKEIESFGIKDSLTLAISGVDADSVEYKKETSGFMKGFWKIVGGGKYYSQDSTFRVKHYGLINTKAVSFNSVDGLTYSQGLAIKKLVKWDDRFDFWPEIKYSFGRKDLMWKLRSSLATDYIRHTQFYIEGGQWSKDFNSQNGIAPFVNMASSLLLKDNYMKLYKDNYFLIGGSTDLANGLNFQTTFKYQNVNRLENSTNYSFGYPNRDYRPNNVVNNYNDLDLFRDRKIFQVESKLTFTPKYYYRIEGAVKRMAYSDYPTFTLRYNGGFEGVFGSESRFDLVELGIKQELEWSFMYKFNYDLRAGYYFNLSSMHFSNFTHFNTSEVPISFKDWKNNFKLLNDYEHSTNDWYLEAHLHYSTPYLLVKNLPFLQDKLWNENLYFSHLTQPNFKNYNEVGYGISQIFLVANVGVFAGFEEFEFSKWGVRLSFKFADL